MLDGIIHQLVDFLLVVRQAHHAKAQEGYLFARSVLHTIGHTVLNGFLVFLCESTQRLHCHQGHRRSCADTESLQKLSAVHV